MENCKENEIKMIKNQAKYFTEYHKIYYIYYFVNVFVCDIRNSKSSLKRKSFLQIWN